jgi:poly-gamma-glutamate synthesis protein (capsule biosynthesis protein)
MRLSLVGDCITPRSLNALLSRDAGFAAAIGKLRDADVVFGNLENSVFDIRHFQGTPRTMDDWPLIAPPAAAADLAELGFRIMSRANNHCMDWGVEALHETDRWMDAAGIVTAGVGITRARARAPRYIETAGGRVALVSFHTASAVDQAAALDQFGEVPARPGFNAIRLRRTVTVDHGTFETMRDLAARMHPTTKGKDASGRPGSPDSVDLMETTFRPGGGVDITYSPVEEDTAALARSVRLAAEHADIVIVSGHVHEEGPDTDTPPAFLTNIARLAIEAGADIYAGHGVHRLWPIEIYRDRPILYGLGNFFFMGICEPLTESMYAYAREALGGRDPTTVTDADVNLALNDEDFDDARYFQSVIAEVDFDGIRLDAVRLHPVELGFKSGLTNSGIPRLASGDAAGAIVSGLAQMSAALGTRVSTEDGVGVVEIPD